MDRQCGAFDTCCPATSHCQPPRLVLRGFSLRSYTFLNCAFDCAPWRCPWRPGSPALKTAALDGSGPNLGSMCWANSCVEAPPESRILFLPAPARPGCSNSALSREGPLHRLPRSRICHPMTVGVQDMPLHYAPLGHTDYFELQALEKQQMQGEGDSPEGTQ